MKNRSANEPLVSVITPVYNVEPYLAEAVESVIAQSCRDWELLLVDDGSTDGSLRIARKFAEEHPERIFCLQHNGGVNKGASASRNLGLAQARGDFIAFLDSDDVWFPDKLAHQLDLMGRHPSAVMVCGSSLYWRGWMGGEDKHVLVGCRQNTLFQPPELMSYLYPLKKGAAPCMNALLVRRGTIEETGGFVDKFTGMYDDQVFLSKIYLSRPVYVTDKIYDKYRQGRPGSICSTSENAGDYRDHRMRYLNWLESYLDRNEIDCGAVRKNLAAELAKCRRRDTELQGDGTGVRARLRTALKRLLGREQAVR